MLSDLQIPERYRSFLRIGTCSWKYDSWKGLIYDSEKKYGPYDYLADYAKAFNTVEIDQWFWSLFPRGIKLPDSKTVKVYVDSVPDDFLFTVKVPNSITLTPGTLTVDIVDRDYYIHWISVPEGDVERHTKMIVGRFEWIIRKVFE